MINTSFFNTPATFFPKGSCVCSEDGGGDGDGGLWGWGD